MESHGGDKRPFDKSSDPAAQERNAGKRRVLIVDDDELVRDSLRILVSRYGYEARTASNGFEALEMLDEDPYALMIIDIRMPGITGIETVQAVRETALVEVNRSIPVIFITGYADREAEFLAGRVGCEAYLSKPFADTRIWQLLSARLT